MEDEIEDLIGEVKCTDSQKSVDTSYAYSLDFTESCSEKNNSSGKETYILGYDSDASLKTFHDCKSIVKLNQIVEPVKSNDASIQYETIFKINQSASTSLENCCVLKQETYTQTSKTIIELAAADVAARNSVANTQTSVVSITENRTIAYKITLSDANALPRNKVNDLSKPIEYERNELLNNSLDDGSSKFPASESDTENRTYKSNKSDTSSNDELLQIIHDESTENIECDDNDEQFKNDSDYGSSNTTDSDIEDDSLLENKSRNNRDCNSDISEISVSGDNDLKDLYKKISENTAVRSPGRESNFYERRFDLLTPLTEEPAMNKDSLLDITPVASLITENTETEKDVIFANKGLKIKVLPQEESKTDALKLPPIRMNLPNIHPNLDYLFTINAPHKIIKKPDSFHCGGQIDRWEIASKDLASGEGVYINGNIQVNNSPLILPPIETEKKCRNIKYRNNYSTKLHSPKANVTSPGSMHDSISIKKRITELKMKNKNCTQIKSYGASSPTSRSMSPVSVSPTESRLEELAERGCDALCTELIKKLGSHSWSEISETLENTPRLLEKFWGVITENRIADIIRQVSGHVESPRTQVARTACSTLASILKNTNYTKKPDFYEAVTSLLIKTGSFSRPVRRAANVALDEIVCGVDLTHAVTALCVHGVGHKSPLVRCASARLLVVCCALGSGGRELLRTRPPSAASARRLALQSLAALLDDKNTDARKYAERLYSMLRPLGHFEAYYLTDVDVELATRQMKKYDRLMCKPADEAR